MNFDSLFDLSFQKFALIAFGTWFGVTGLIIFNEKYIGLKNPFRRQDPVISDIIEREKRETYFAQTRFLRETDTSTFKRSAQAGKLSEHLNIGDRIHGQALDIDEAMRQKASVGGIVYTSTVKNKDEQSKE